jgi:hypothetical protein
MKCHHCCHHYSRSLKTLVFPVKKGHCHHFYTREGERFLYFSPSSIRKVVTGQYLQGFFSAFHMGTGMVTEACEGRNDVNHKHPMGREVRDHVRRK